MTSSVVQKPDPQSKPIPLSEQVSVLTMIRGRDLRLLFPALNGPEDAKAIEWIKARLDAAANTLSQLTDW